MSEAEIQSLCEAYIGRPFEDDDVQSLRTFLRLLKNKVKKTPSAASTEVSASLEKKETRVLVAEDPVSPLVAKDSPIFGKIEGFVRAVSTTKIEKTTSIDVGSAQPVSERKNQYKAATEASTPTKSTVDIPHDGSSSPRHLDRIGLYTQQVKETPTDAKLVEERVKEARSSIGVKDRLGNWSQVLDAADKTTSAPPEKVEERLAEVKGATAVKDRLGNWSQVLDAADKPTSAPPEKVEERLAEVKGATAVKDRLGNWAKVVSENETKVITSTSDPSLIEDRLGEEFAKASVGVKDRKTNWVSPQADVETSDPSKVEERLAEVKGASGVRDRLDTWGKVATQADKVVAADPLKVEERLAEVKGATGIKDRLNALQEVVAENEKIVIADPDVVQERLQGIERTTSINARAGAWSATANDGPAEGERKQPIELPTEEVTKEQQGI